MSTTTESLQQALSDLFAPWVQALNLKVERFDADSVTVRLPALTEAERARVEPLVQQAAGKPLAACP
mgnify:CR=1 FL=1